ncbi:hypothetical protein AAFF_G00355540 [Aldrovandia affinis]|uniref:SET domain-containing protein n=1 Tax=Aldrovandia affinis TaxID=143900 RepID=A0AAD7R5R9_9TELE|nr:hypothetical protein AAFF_G00355540 [Aldrovandia affinis]
MLVRMSPAEDNDSEDEEWRPSMERRYVNCARNEEEQNLVEFQYRGSILYHCFKPILPGRELLVWYGEEYAKDLGITLGYLWSNKCSAKGSLAPQRTGPRSASVWFFPSLTLINLMPAMARQCSVMVRELGL